jgi:hypothetical protein
MSLHLVCEKMEEGNISTGVMEDDVVKMQPLLRTTSLEEGFEVDVQSGRPGKKLALKGPRLHGVPIQKPEVLVRHRQPDFRGVQLQVEEGLMAVALTADLQVPSHGGDDFADPPSKQMAHDKPVVRARLVHDSTKRHLSYQELLKLSKLPVRHRSKVRVEEKNNQSREKVVGTSNSLVQSEVLESNEVEDITGIDL